MSLEKEITALPEGYEVIFTAEDQEVQKAMVYLQMKDERITMPVIAEKFGYKTRQGMEKRRDRWIENGVLEKARRKYFIPKGEEINASISRVMEEVPYILDRMVKIARAGREKNAIEATMWLWENVIRPEREKQPARSNSEEQYAKRSDQGIQNPMIITIEEEASPVIESLPESVAEIPDNFLQASPHTLSEADMWSQNLDT